KLRADLFRYRCVLEQRDIHVLKSRAGKASSAQIPPSPNRRNKKRVGIKPLILLFEQHGTGKRRVQRWPVRVASVSVAGAIRADLRRKRKTGEQCRYAIDLPAADELARDSRCATQPLLTLSNG